MSTHTKVGQGKLNAAPAKAPEKAAPAAVKAPVSAPVPPTSGDAGKSEAEGGEKVKQKRKPLKRVLYPALWDAATNTRVKLKAAPTDWKSSIHKALTRKDFEDDSLFFEFRAIEMDARAKKYREMAAEAKLVGSTAQGAGAKRLVALQRKMLELMEQLKAQGIDADGLLAKTAAAAEPAKG